MSNNTLHGLRMQKIIVEIPDNSDEIVLLNTRTQKIEEQSSVLIKKYSADRWEKAIVEHLVSAIGIVGSKKTKVLLYIIKNKNIDNQIIATQTQIAKMALVTRPTVSAVIDALTAAGYIKKINSGAYMLNPDVLAFGSVNRLRILATIWRKS